MKIAVFDTHHFEKEYFDRANVKFGHELTYFDVKLSEESARLAFGYDVVCPFVNGRLNSNVLEILKSAGVKLIALRSVGFNHVDLEAAQRLGLPVVRVPSYSPHAVAEHAVALMLALNRKICRAYSRVHEGNFSLEGLVGFDLFGKTVGVLGTGQIGSVLAKIMNGFGCKVLAYDTNPKPGLEGIEYVKDIRDIYKRSDIISLHLPLTPATRHIINAMAFEFMKPGVMIINTGRGALIDTRALIDALKSGRIGFAGLDVYEEEEKVFFQDLSDQVLQDDVLARLMTFRNVIITSHQAFLTREALMNIAQTTLENVTDLEQGRKLVNRVNAADVIKTDGVNNENRRGAL